MFAVAVKAAIQEAQSLLQYMFVLGHHALSHHLLLSHQPLVLVTPETTQPHRPPDQLFRVSFKITQNADVVVDAEHASLLCPPVHLLQGRDGVHPQS